MRFGDQAGHHQTDSQPGLFRGYKRFENLFRPGADLRFADFRPLGQARTTGLSIVALKTAENWDKAYYDDDTLKTSVFRRTTIRIWRKSRSRNNSRRTQCHCADETDSRLLNGLACSVSNGPGASLRRRCVPAKTLADDLDKRFPEHTIVQAYYLPTIRAQLALEPE